MPVVADESPRESDSAPRRKRRRVAGSRVVKISLPAALAERLALAGIQQNRKPSAVVADLLEKHLPRLSIRMG